MWLYSSEYNRWKQGNRRKEGKKISITTNKTMLPKKKKKEVIISSELMKRNGTLDKNAHFPIFWWRECSEHQRQNVIFKNILPKVPDSSDGL